MNIKVGDTVRVLTNYPFHGINEFLLTNKIGTVVKVMGKGILVRFNDWSGGHNGFGMADELCLTGNHCYWMRGEYLELLYKEEEKKNMSDYATGGVIKNNKYVLGSLTKFELTSKDGSKMALLPKPKKVIIKPNDEMIIVLWQDGTKTIVKCCEDDNFDVDNGIARAYIKKIYGTNGKFRKQYKDLIDIHY